VRGYCEACRRENEAENDEYGVACCIDCGNDIMQEVHVADGEPEEEHYEYPQFYDGPY